MNIVDEKEIKRRDDLKTIDKKIHTNKLNKAARPDEDKPDKKSKKPQKMFTKAPKAPNINPELLKLIKQQNEFHEYKDSFKKCFAHFLASIDTSGSNNTFKEKIKNSKDISKILAKKVDGCDWFEGYDTLVLVMTTLGKYLETKFGE